MNSDVITPAFVHNISVTPVLAFSYDQCSSETFPHHYVHLQIVERCATDLGLSGFLAEMSSFLSAQSWLKC